MSFRERTCPPLLRRHCGLCHGGQAGLYVDSYNTLMAGGSKVRGIAPGDTENSTMLRWLTGEVQPRMLLNRPSMSKKDIAVIETWILEGAANN